MEAARVIDPRTRNTNDIRCIVQKRYAFGWGDVSELFFYLPTAEAALKRFQEDEPSHEFRLASLEWGD